MERVKVFKALSDDNRLKIVELLQSGEMCGCTILEKMNVVQSTLSHHLKILVDSGIVAYRREGKWAYYSLNDTGCENALNVLKTLVKKSDCYVAKCDSCE